MIEVMVVGVGVGRGEDPSGTAYVRRRVGVVLKLDLIERCKHWKAVDACLKGDVLWGDVLLR